MKRAKGAKAGNAVGREIVEGLTELAGTQESGAGIGATFTCHRVEFKLPRPSYSATDVKRTRSRIRCSQAVFAEVMGVTVRAVRAWEQSLNRPSLTAQAFTFRQ